MQTHTRNRSGPSDSHSDGWTLPCFYFYAGTLCVSAFFFSQLQKHKENPCVINTNSSVCVLLVFDTGVSFFHPGWSPAGFSWLNQRQTSDTFTHAAEVRHSTTWQNSQPYTEVPLEFFFSNHKETCQSKTK